jgi:cell division initiation protein
MHITPLDIRKQTFSKKTFGADGEEVKNFLDMVASSIENMTKDFADKEDRLKGLEKQIEIYKNIEQNMQDTLMTAQRITDEIKVNAQKEADLIVKDAQIRAHKEMEIAREKALQFQREVADLRHQKGMFLARFRSLLTTQLEMLNVMEGEESSVMTEESANAKNM